MPKQVEVLVEDIGLDDNGLKTELYGTRRTLTYKSFIYLNSNPENPRYKLIGEVDEKGDLVPGNPNLKPQHKQESEENAKHAADAGQSKRGPGRPKQTVTETVA